MNIFAQISPNVSEKTIAFFHSLVKIILGSFFLACCAKLTIPIKPVPMTLQTLGVFILGILLDGRHAAAATLLYLIQGSIGLPVLSQGVSPLWIFGPTAGYLLAMPIAAYMIGIITRKGKQSSLKVVIAIFCAQLVIYSFGALFLSRFVSFEKAFLLGVLPFLPFAFFKLIFASSLSRVYLHLKALYGN